MILTLMMNSLLLCSDTTRETMGALPAKRSKKKLQG